MTTLEILRGTYETVAIPFEDVCREIGMKLQTGRNEVSKKTFPVPTYLQGGRRFAHIGDLAKYLDGKQVEASGKRRVGRPTNAERAAVAQGGEA